MANKIKIFLEKPAKVWFKIHGKQSFRVQKRIIG
jgi:hypothetical protein